MAVFYDSAGTGNQFWSPYVTIIPFSFSWSHTARGGDIGVVAAISFWVGQSSLAQITRTVTYGGTTMTSLGTAQWGGSDTGWVELFGLTNAPTGTSTVQVDIRGGAALTGRLGRGNTVSYSGVSNFGTFTSASGTGTAMSMSTTPATASLSVGTYSTRAGIYGFNRTQRYSTNTNVSMVLGDVDGTGTAQTITATRGSSGNWAGASVILQAADVVATAKQVVSDTSTAAQGKRYPRTPSFVRRSVFNVNPEQ